MQVSLPYRHVLREISRGGHWIHAGSRHDTAVQYCYAVYEQHRRECLQGSVEISDQDQDAGNSARTG